MGRNSSTLKVCTIQLFSPFHFILFNDSNLTLKRFFDKKAFVFEYPYMGIFLFLSILIWVCLLLIILIWACFAFSPPGDEERLEHAHQHHMQLAQSVFTSTICSAALPIIHLMEDVEVNQDGIAGTKSYFDFKNQRELPIKSR